MKNYSKIIRAGFLTLLFGVGSSAYGQYCTPTYSTGCSFGDDLNSVVLNGITVSLSNLNSGCNGSYSDNTSMNAPDLAPGLSYTLSVGTSYTFPEDESVRAWIDYNENDIFDANELIGEISGLSAGLNAIPFTVPATTTMGVKRMRVMLDYSMTASVLTPCAASTYGETEDYNVEIVSPPNCLPPQSLNLGNITANSIDFSWTEINSATEWEVEYGAYGYVQGSGTPQITTSNPYVATIVPGNEYDFYVRSICSVGDTSAWAGPFSYKYCDVSAQYTSEYLSVANSVGALVNFNYTASSFPAGSYADETAQQFEAFETQTFDVNTTYSAGSNGVSIYVDWNNNSIFEPSELMSTQGSTSAVLVSSVTVPAGTPQGDYRMRIRGQWGSTSNPPACGSITWGSTVDVNLTIVAPPSCLPPNDLVVSNVAETSLDLGWTANGVATTWNIEYGPAGFTPGTGTMINGVTTNPYSITGLTGNTNYEFYVQGDCGGGDLSYWSPSSGNILTECGSSLANGFCESFDINLSPSIGCWRVRDENGDGDAWGVSTQNPNTGAYSAVFYSDYNAGNNDDYLISPQLIMTGIEAMKFAYRVQSANEPNDFQVLLSTTGTNVADFTDTIMGLAEYSNTDYLDTVIDLTSYTGPVYIAFHIPPGGLDGWNLYIDDVCFGECIPTPGVDGTVDVCRLDGLVDLSDGIVSHNNSYGYWEFEANQGLIVDDTMFNIGMMAEGSHEVMYIVQGLCQKDTTIATINVHGVSSAGIDGEMTVCKNTPSNLFSALSGTVDMGGTWYDPANVALPNSQPHAPNIPGMYQYTYITDNGFCPSDTSIVTVTVDGTCDNLSVGEDILMDVSVYPNPATSILTVVNPSNQTSLKVEMLDMNGRVVLVENKALNNASETTLTIDHLEKGIYTLRVYNNEGQKTFKIVKQ